MHEVLIHFATEVNLKNTVLSESVQSQEATQFCFPGKARIGRPTETGVD